MNNTTTTFNEANQAFLNNEFLVASEKYKEIISEILKVANPTKEDTTTTASLKKKLILCYSNRAACLYRLRKFEDAIADANACVELDRTWHKAYYRKAQCFHSLGKSAEAYELMVLAIRLDEGKTQAYLDFQQALRDSPTTTTSLAQPHQQQQQQQQQQKKRIPTIILSGFLGAGKTTLVTKLLNSNQLSNKKIALFINDMAEVNMDAKFLKNNVLVNPQKKSSPALIELNNGCICCTIRDDFVSSLWEVLRNEHNRKVGHGEALDLIIIEASGISEPIPVAQALTFPLPTNTTSNESLLDWMEVMKMITVVDSSSLMKDLLSHDTLKTRRLHSTEGDERNLSKLLMDQLEFSNFLVLNKTDLLSATTTNNNNSGGELHQLRAFLDKVNPTSEKVVTNYCEFDFNLLWNKPWFDWKKAHLNIGWKLELLNAHIPETVTYGITSFVYTQQDKAFDLIAFVHVYESLAKHHGVLRSKGFAYFHPDLRIVFQVEIAGYQAQLVSMGFNRNESDYKTQIVFIGREMNVSDIKQRLDSISTLVTDDWKTRLAPKHVETQVGGKLYVEYFKKWYDKM